MIIGDLLCNALLFYEKPDELLILFPYFNVILLDSFLGEFLLAWRVQHSVCKSAKHQQTGTKADGA
jgi:hypothetical protein